MKERVEMSIGCFIAVALALWLAIAACTGCATVDGKKQLDTCRALAIAQGGHQVASGASAIVCAALEGEARKKCMKYQERASAAANAMVVIAGSIAEACRR